MSFTRLPKQELTTFRGPMVPPHVELSDIPSDCSTVAENVSFGPGYVKTREGHASFFTPSHPVTSLYNWTSVHNLNRLVYKKSNSDLVVRALADGSEAVIGNFPSSSDQYAESGNKLFMAVSDSTGTGSSGCRVYTGEFQNGNPMIMRIAPGPVQGTGTAVDSVVAGVCTAGVHKFALLRKSVTGYVGNPGPYSSGSFSPAVVTSAGGKRITVTFTITQTGPFIEEYYIIMTAADNTERYYRHPELISSAPANTSNYQLSVTVDISDDTLTQVGIEATEYFNKWCQTADGTDPFKPTSVRAFNNRMVYITRKFGVVSDVDDFESFTQDQHVVYVPGQKPISTGFAMRGSFYWLSDNGTYVSNDVGGAPSTWPRPVSVSDNIGTPSAFGVASNIEMGYAFVAAEHGLYVFNGGVYEALPMSYYQTPIWKRINWSNPNLIKVIDSPTEQRVYVVVPLDGATSASHILTYCYKDGKDAGSVSMSLDSITGVGISDACMVLDTTTRERSLVVAASSSAAVYRRYGHEEAVSLGANGHKDGTLKIADRFSTGPVPGATVSGKLHIRAVTAGLGGSGYAQLSVRSIYGSRNYRLIPVKLTSTVHPSTRRFGHSGSRVIFTITSDSSIGSYWLLSGIEVRHRGRGLT